MTDKKNGLDVIVYKSKKHGIKQPKACTDNILPKMHCSYMIIGKSGSGKTNALIHLLSSESLLKNAFDVILYMSTSADDTFKDNIKIPKENIIKNWDEEYLEKLCNKQKAFIENNGILKAKNVLIIFDDILSRQKFLNSKILIKLVTECRHYNISCIFNTQSYMKIPRTVRLNCRGLVLFPSSLGEVVKFAEEQCLPNISQRDFIKAIQFITEKPYQFVFINNDAPNDEKLRMNFNKIIKIK